MPSITTDVLTSSLGKAIALAYGRNVVAGNVILQHQGDDGRTVAFIALGEGEWDAIEELYVNGALVDINSVGTFHFHRGSAGEVSNDNLLNPEGTGALYPFTDAGDQKVDALTPPGVQGLTFSNTAYLALSIPFDAYAPGPALDVRGVYRTRRVRIFNSAGVQIDYRYSENPVWQIADLLTRIRGLADSRLDWESFAASAAYCDEPIPVEGGFAPRFVSHIAFADDQDLDSALTSLLLTCRGSLMDSAGVLELSIAQPRPNTFDFHSGNILDGSFHANLEDTRGTANRIELHFRDLENNFALMTKFWNHELQQTRVGKVLTTRLDLGNMTQHQAERIGNYLLVTSIDSNFHCMFTSTLASLSVHPGDVVRIQADSAPWSQGHVGESRYKSFEVLEVSDNPDGTREFLCRAYNADAYSDSAGPAQSLIATNLRRRPLPPPKPPLWGLFANLAGDLKLRFAIPRNADYRTGELILLADDELQRQATTLALTLNESDQTLSVATSTNFLVGDYINIGSEVLYLAGPGVKGAPPVSNDWIVGRGQRGSETTAAAADSAVYRLSERNLHFVLPPGYSIANPTLNLASGKYHQVIFRPGRLRVLHAHLRFTGLGGLSEPVEASYAVAGLSEPEVSGGLSGLRVSSGGKLQLQVPGPLASGADLLQPIYAPQNVSLGIVYASVEKSPLGQSILFQLLLNGVAIGPVAEIPETIEGESSGSGVVFSGAEIGAIGGGSLAVDIIQTGSEFPGEDLTINLTL